MNGLVCLRLLPSHVALLGSCEGDEGSCDGPSVESEKPGAKVECAEVETPLTSLPSSEDEKCMQSHEKVAEKFLEIDKENVKTLTREKRLKDEFEELHKTDVSMWSTLRGKRKHVSLPRGCKVFLMEVFAGAAVLSSIAASMSLDIAAPVDLMLDGSDLLKPAVRTPTCFPSVQFVVHGGLGVI